jgi:acyl-CoA synthetase (AMP-forming)/AMP-acid ligase II
VLYHHPGVLEAGVTGTPDPMYGERVVAFVSLRKGAALGEKELREHLRTWLADYKVPERIVPCPRGGDWLEDELDQMKRAGVDVLVPRLQVDEAAELGLSPEAELCEAGGIVFRSFPIPDRETPPSTAHSLGSSRI